MHKWKQVRGYIQNLLLRQKFLQYNKHCLPVCALGVHAQLSWLPLVQGGTEQRSGVSQGAVPLKLI